MIQRLVDGLGREARLYGMVMAFPETSREYSHLKKLNGWRSDSISCNEIPDPNEGQSEMLMIT
jgi:hypothetical protein